MDREKPECAFALQPVLYRTGQLTHAHSLVDAFGWAGASLHLLAPG